MPRFTLDTFSSTARTLDSGDTGFITARGSLVVNSDAIDGSGNNTLTVLGALASTLNNGHAYDFDGAAATITMGQLATATADGDTFSLNVTEQARLYNHGVITSGEDAIDARDTDGAASIFIKNAGGISSLSDGMVLSSGTGATRVVNSGTVHGDDVGIFVIDGDTTVYNSGVITGNDRAYEGGDQNDTIVNAGQIFGDLDLDDGADIYDGRKGEIDGTVFGEAGDDTLRGGAQDDDLQGGTGNDVLNGGAGDDKMGGGADDDILRGKAGDDNLTGADGNDTLRGNAGMDVIKGGKGGDSIKGGKDDDALTGNGGADSFVFGRHDGADIINDFQNGVDRIDIEAFGLRASDFNSVVAPALSNAGGHVFLDFAEMGGSGSVLVKGLSLSDVGASDFLF